MAALRPLTWPPATGPVHTVRASLAKMRHVGKSVDSLQEQTAHGHRMERNIVDLTVWMALAYLAIVAISDAFVLSMNDSDWKSPSADAIYIIAWSSTIMRAQTACRSASGPKNHLGESKS